MKRIGLLSDTHSFLDPTLLKHFEACDEVWHAGDIGNVAVANALEAFKPFRAVYGNIDGQPIRIRYPENQIFEVEGLKVLMTHIGGYPGRYTARVKGLLQKHRPGLYICGHSHILKVMPDPKSKPAGRAGPRRGGFKSGGAKPGGAKSGAPRRRRRAA